MKIENMAAVLRDVEVVIVSRIVNFSVKKISDL